MYSKKVKLERFIEYNLAKVAEILTQNNLLTHKKTSATKNAIFFISNLNYLDHR